LCRFDGERLPEISGLAYSTLHEGIVWAHNDSGGGARLYAIDIDDCAIRAVLRVKGIKASDPEAIASGAGPTGAPALWWGDIGDNTSQRRFVEIHQIPEPATLGSASVTPQTYRVRLDDRQDSEALLADGDRMWLIGKGLLGGNVWRLPQPLRPDRIARARVVGTEEALVTDAAMRPGGGYAVRDYSEVRIYSGLPPGDLVSRMPLPEQVQGEAMTWTPDGTALIIASEGDDRLLRVPVDAPVEGPVGDQGAATPAAPATPPTPTPSAPTGSASPTPVPTTPVPTTPVPTTPGDASPSPVAAALEPVDRVGSLAVLALVIGAGVFIVSAAAVAVVARVRSRH
jgi:hypothetical protein